MLRGLSGERRQDGARPCFVIVVPGAYGDLRGHRSFDWAPPGTAPLLDMALPFFQGEMDSPFPVPPRGLKRIYAGCCEGRLVIHGWLYDRCTDTLPNRYAEALANLARYLNELVTMTGRAVCLYGEHQAGNPGTPRFWGSRKKALWEPDRRPTRFTVTRQREAALHKRRSL